MNISPIQFYQNTYNQNQMPVEGKNNFLSFMKLAMAKNSNLTEYNFLASSDNLNIGDLLLNYIENGEVLLNHSNGENQVSIADNDDGEVENKKNLEYLMGLLGEYNLVNLNKLDLLNKPIGANKIDSGSESSLLDTYEGFQNLRNFVSYKLDSSLIKDKVKSDKTLDFQPNFILKKEIDLENINKEVPKDVEIRPERLSEENELVYGSYSKGLYEKSLNLVEGNKIIKVGDEATEIKTHIFTQVKDKIIVMYEDKNLNSPKEVTLQLQPHNLGKVNIKMIFEEDNLLVEIKDLNEEAYKILSANKEEIANVLSKVIDGKVSIDVKPAEIFHENQPIYNANNNQNFEEIYKEDNNQNSGQGRNKRYHNRKNDEEDSNFSELINLRNFKINI